MSQAGEEGQGRRQAQRGRPWWGREKVARVCQVWQSEGQRSRRFDRKESWHRLLCPCVRSVQMDSEGELTTCNLIWREWFWYFLPYFCRKHFSGVDKDKCKAENMILVRINCYKKNLKFAFLLTLQLRKTFQAEQGQFGTGAIARLHLGGQGDQGGGHHQGGRRQCRGVRRIPGDQVTSADGRSSPRLTGCIDSLGFDTWVEENISRRPTHGKRRMRKCPGIWNNSHGGIDIQNVQSSKYWQY